jgi:hypothetical protein
MESIDVDQVTAQELIVDTTLLHHQPELDSRDREILRALAGEVADLAAQPIQLEKRNLWYRHNRLEATRPIVIVFPENAWNEIIPAEKLLCSDIIARDWEMVLRQQIFYGNRMGDDYTITPYFDVAHVHQDPDWGLAEKRIGGEHNTAYTWTSPIKTAVDIDRLHPPVFHIDFAATKQLAELAENVFGDLLPVRVRTAWIWTVGLTWTLVNLRGLEQMMYDLVDSPDLIHRLMGLVRDGTAALLDALQDARLLGLNNDAAYVASGGLGWSDELPQPDYAGTTRLKDIWGFGESQETVAVSPYMFERFIFPYQLPLLDRFGLNAYGCCEPLEKRWRIIKSIPRLRRVSVSPWSNRAVMAGNLEDHYIYSMKPRPSDLAMDTVDEDRIRAEIRQDLEATKGCRLEIIMKDTHTIRHEPERLIRWVQIVREEIESVWS